MALKSLDIRLRRSNAEPAFAGMMSKNPETVLRRTARPFLGVALMAGLHRARTPSAM
ncbi:MULTISPECIES: hypothetical protein [unclassified Lysobacter]|uniref:hypothetical protein n=1 Tax=unclassified Lysobacter TaxID=2635362 RepID=UPI001BED18CF|nr:MULTISPECIES: hypothetical protein [unclassified Lysobacter]MBT2748021.1 hypothetical protein [Lysobacter sp. ISL-42]MBT2752767.1 hypothetical protein [Lysobacter sp. ISL-50]MBT2781911.1 hypothetical protein [Lysobacter sp. ISL-52]